MPRLPFVPALALPLLALSAGGAAAQEETPPPERYGLRLEYREYRPTATGNVQTVPRKAPESMPFWVTRLASSSVRINGAC